MNFWRVLLINVTDRWRLPVAVGLTAALLTGCSQPPEYLRFSASTMGTYYSVTCRCTGPESPGQDLSAAELQALVDAELVQVNAEMSTYDPASALSRFNASPPGNWIAVPPALAEVVDTAAQLSELSDGAFDVTVGPLVNAWGFGPEASVPEGPDDQELMRLLAQIGYQQLAVRFQPPELRKSGEIYVDLSAIAKGHGVDRIAVLLERSGCLDYLVDIGGEVRVRGRNPRGLVWSIGVEVPDPGAQGEVQRILKLTDQSVATSGDYRNFRTVAGSRLSHTIDPRNGRPVGHDLASVTVVHQSAMWADGLATAITVLGPEQGEALARSLDLPVLMIIRSADGFEERYTEPMQNLLVTP